MKSEVVDVREEMRRLPGFLQPLLTQITGKPYSGQKPLYRSNAWTHTLNAFAGLLGGATLGGWSAMQGGVWLLLLIPSWLIVAGAARKIQVTLAHQCAHYMFTGNKKVDTFFGHLFTTLIMVDHFDSYYHDHIRVHHTRDLGSPDDPDCAFLLSLGFRPGMSTEKLRRHLLWTVMSPAFHWKFLRARLAANFLNAPIWRRLVSVAYHAAILAAVAATDLWIPFLAGWVLPITMTYHIAALLNFSSLHFWLKEPEPGANAKAIMCALSHGRFLGDLPPARELRGARWLGAWSVWWARLLFVHVPIRVGVLNGDLPVHDYHHRHARCGEWGDYLYTRQRDIDAGCPGWGIDYIDSWGLGHAITSAMTSISQARPLPAADSHPAGGILEIVHT